MITIKTGKLFVKKYNEENGTSLTPKEAFCMLADKAFRGGRQMACWTNSKFFQYMIAYQGFLKGKKEEPSFDKALKEFCDELENSNCGVETSLNVYGGCGIPSKNEMPTTEFSYCDNIHFSIDERYYSFIGSFFQICVAGFNTVIENEEAVWLLYESFNAYYDFIHNNEEFKDKQLFTWNGCYLYKVLTKQGDRFIEEKKMKNDGGVETISFMEYLVAITKTNWKCIKNIIFENFGQTNATGGYITLDLDGVVSLFSIMRRIVANIDEDFDVVKYSKIFKKDNLLRMSMERGEVTEEMIDPLYYFKTSFKEEEFKNKEGIKFLNEYLKIIMTEQEKDLAMRFGEFIKNASKGGKKTLSVKEEVNNIFSSYDVVKFGEAILAFCKKANVPTEGVPYEVISYFVDGTKSNRLREFIMFTKFNS